MTTRERERELFEKLVEIKLGLVGLVDLMDCGCEEIKPAHNVALVLVRNFDETLQKVENEVFSYE